MSAGPLCRCCSGRARLSSRPQRLQVKAAWKWAAPVIESAYVCHRCLECSAMLGRAATQTILCFRKEVNGELRCYRFSHAWIETQPEQWAWDSRNLPLHFYTSPDPILGLQGSVPFCSRLVQRPCTQIGCCSATVPALTSTLESNFQI